MKSSLSMFLCLIVVLHLSLPTTHAIVKMVPVGSKIDFHFNINFFNISYVFHQPTSVTNQSIEFQIEIKQKIKDMKLLLVYHGMTKNGTVSSVLLKRQVDLCSFLRNTKSDRLVKSMYDYINARSHIPTRCPFLPGCYYMRNLKLADIPIPAFLPETDFFLEVVYFSGVRSETMVELRMYGNKHEVFGTHFAPFMFVFRIPCGTHECVREGKVRFTYKHAQLLSDILVIFGTRVELKNSFKIFNVSYTFHNPKSLTNQSLDFNIILKRDLADLKRDAKLQKRLLITKSIAAIQLVVSYHVVALNNTIQNALLKRSIDICFFLRNPRSDRLVKSIFDYIKQRSYLPSKCPIPADTYYMHNLKLADMPLPALLPETEFMVELAYYVGIRQEITASFRLYGKLIRLVAVGTKMESNCYGKLVNLSCALQPGLSPANQTLNCDIEVFREVREIKLTAVYYTVALNKLVQTVLLKRSLNLCFFVRNPQSDRLVNSVYNYVKKRSNLPSKCPLAPGNYYIRNIRPSDVPIPAFLPESEFVLEEVFRSEARHENFLEFRFYGKLLVAVAKKIEFKTLSRTFNVSYKIHNPKSITNHSIEFDIDVTRKIKDLRLTFLYHSVTQNGTVQTALIRRPIDICFFLRNPRSDRLVKTVYDYVNDRSNLPTRCPFGPGSYHARNIRTSDVPVPSFLPLAEFILELIYYSEVRGEKMMEFRLHGKLVRLIDAEGFVKVLHAPIRARLPALALFCPHFLVQLIPVLSKIVVKHNTKTINVTCTISNIGTITNQTVTFEMVMFQRLNDMKASFSFHVVGLDGDSLDHIISRTSECVCVFVASVDGSIRLVAVGTKMETNSYEKFINLSCAFRPGLSLANQTVNCAIEVFREIKEIKLTLTYSVVTLNKLVQTVLLKRSLNLCFFMRNPQSDRLVNTVYKYIKQRNDLPERCPVAPGNYYMHNMRPSDVPIPSFLPESEFVLEKIFRSEVKHETLVEFRFYGKLAFVKLVPYCTEVEFISKVKNIKLSTTYHRRESVTEQSFDFGVDILSPVRDLKLSFIYYSIAGNGTVRNVVFKRTVDMCFYMQNPNSDRLLKVVYDYVRQRTNLPKRCPVPAASYYLRNIRPADVPVPAFIPEAEFIMELIYRNEVKREIMVEFRCYGKLIRIIGRI
uniref:Uncharacterized protein n=1 Tax=Anopheles minimus TaxID=112268 RepID=A0A182W208_9DIPT